MTAIQLRAELFREMSPLFHSEAAMEKIYKTVVISFNHFVTFRFLFVPKNCGKHVETPLKELINLNSSKYIVISVPCVDTVLLYFVYLHNRTWQNIYIFLFNNLKFY